MYICFTCALYPAFAHGLGRCVCVCVCVCVVDKEIITR